MATYTPPPVYLIEGHGSEHLTPFGNRMKVPAGYTLVALSQCSVSVYTQRACRFVDFARSPKNLTKLARPEPTFLEKYLGEIRVYKEGDSMPYLVTNLDSHHTQPNDNKMDFYKAGVYQAPHIPTASKKAFPTDVKYDVEKRARCYKYSVATLSDVSSLSEAQYNEIYRGAIGDFHPSYKMVLGMKETPLPGVPISHIMEKLGPGTYYFLGCRYAKSWISDKAYDDIDDILIRHFRERTRKSIDQSVKNMERMSKQIKQTILEKNISSNEDIEKEISKIDESMEDIPFPPPPSCMHMRAQLVTDVNSEDIRSLYYMKLYYKDLQRALDDGDLSKRDKRYAEHYVKVLKRMIEHTDLVELFQKSDEQQKKYRLVSKSKSP